MRNGWQIATVVMLGVTAFASLYVLQRRVLAQTSPSAAQQAPNQLPKFRPHSDEPDRWRVVLTDAVAQPQGASSRAAPLAQFLTRQYGGQVKYLALSWFLLDAPAGIADAISQEAAVAWVEQAVPGVSVTTPAASSTVRAGVTLSATASDPTAVAGVQFSIDGVNYGHEITRSPYTLSWDTFTATNGSHTITAIARDAADNSTASPSVRVTVSNNLPALQADVITSNPWTCLGNVNINRVIVSNLPPDSDGVYLSIKGKSCSGRIGYLEVDGVPQDGVKIRPGAHDLVIQSGKIRCSTSNGVVHQDGVQGQAGSNITFLNFDDQCLTTLGAATYRR
jgi:Big-like domain-containing protein